jgi:hypothetical protein
LIDKRSGTAILRALALLTLCAGAAVPGFGQASTQHGADSTSWVRYWNQVGIDASGLDHTAVAPGEQRVFGEQFGPCRASRAIAIVQIAIFDAVNAISGGYHSYAYFVPAPDHASMNVAIAQAAHDTLAAMFPSQSPSFDTRLAADLALIPDDRHKRDGIDVGHQAAAAILAERSNDGSQKPEPHIGIDYFYTGAVGEWTEDPISQKTVALGAYWGEVRPFVMQSGDQFRLPPPPALNSPAFAAAFDEVQRLGGDGGVTPTQRTADQTFVGDFWAYDGTPSLCAPTRLYNQITVQIAAQMGTTSTEEFARLLAMANVAMADAAIAVWDSKFFYKCCRPVTGIREAEHFGNPAMVADPTFTPLGAPASNLNGPNFTPPFPSYPSGHAGFGGALFQTLRSFYGTDQIAFTVVSDEFNGVTRDNLTGSVRPLRPRRFSTLSQAEEENGQSRIYLGIHWAFDKTGGIAQGRHVADYVFRNAFTPISRGRQGSKLIFR